MRKYRSVTKTRHRDAKGYSRSAVFRVDTGIQSRMASPRRRGRHIRTPIYSGAMYASIHRFAYNRQRVATLPLINRRAIKGGMRPTDSIALVALPAHAISNAINLREIA